MKNKTIFVTFLFSLLLVLSIMPMVNAITPVQEDADRISCDGVWDPDKPCSNTYDGNWKTYGSPEVSRESVYVNLDYKIPNNLSGDEILFKYKTGWGRGTSFHASCWNGNSWDMFVTEACRYPETYSTTECQEVIPDSCLNDEYLKLKIRLDKPAGTIIKFYEESVVWESEDVQNGDDGEEDEENGSEDEQDTEEGANLIVIFSIIGFIVLITIGSFLIKKFKGKKRR